jgi:hypothetical protein
MPKSSNNRPLRQHFLPQFLLKGFSVRHKNNHYIFEFRANGVVRRGEVRTVGHQRQFYGSEDLERKIAERENKYANLIHELRSGSIDLSMKPLIDEFITHLFVRTNNLRTGMVQMGRAMSDGILEQFERVKPGSQFYDFIQEGLASRETQDTVERELQKLPESARPFVRSMMREYLTSPLMLDHLRAIARQAGPMIDMPQAVQNAQVLILEEEEKIHRRSKLLEPFTWHLFDYSPNALVLGDHGPFGREKERASMRNLIFFDGIAEVYLPVSHQRLLFGNLGGEPSKPDAEELNTNSVELSQEFFVARADSLREQGYRSSIGKRAMIYNPKELREFLEEGLRTDH